MEVVAREDKVTHAVIGGGEQIDFGISGDAMFMHMLSSTLYSDKILAVARETLCNAWDAHIEAGVTDRAIEITLTREKLIIRDFGFGIPRSNIGKVYGTYGNSTKKHDGNQTGGFGLGCKSPFAYVDHFEVTSHSEGTKTIYKMTKSSAEREGKPAIIPILSVPTDETGIAVTIDIASAGDFHRFDNLIKRLVANGEIFAMLNGSELPVIEFSQAPNGYVITKHKLLETRSALCVRYGNVVYPLDRHEGYSQQYDETMQILRRLSGASHHSEVNHSLVLQAQPHTISITPSRETLSMETKTIDTVTEILLKFLATHHSNFSAVCHKLVRIQVDKLVEAKKFNTLLGRRPHLSNIMESTGTHYRNERYLITDTAGAANVVLAGAYPNESGFEAKDMNYRLTQVIKADPELYCRDTLRSYRRETQRMNGRCMLMPLGGGRSPRTWFMKNIIAPVLAPLIQTAGMDRSRLLILGSHEQLKGWGGTVEAYPLDGFRATDMHAYLPFARGIVILTHSKANIDGRVRSFRLEEDKDGYRQHFGNVYGNVAGTLAYVVPRTPKKMAQAREFFQKHARLLIDLTAEVEVREPTERVVRAPAKAKPIGQVKLSACWDRSYSRFDQENLTITCNTMRVAKPKFVTMLNSKSNRHLNRCDLPGFDKVSSRAILTHYGDIGCAVLSTPQVERLIKDGTPFLEDFILGKIEVMLKDKKVRSYMGMTPSRVKSSIHADTQSYDAIELIWGNDAIFKLFKLTDDVTQEQRDLLAIWDYLKRDRRWCAKVDKLKGLEKDIPLHKKAAALAKKIETSKVLPYLDLTKIQEAIEGEFPEDALNLFMKACKG